MYYSPYQSKKENFKYLYSVVRRVHGGCGLQVDEGIRSLAFELSILDYKDGRDFCELLRKARHLVLGLRGRDVETVRQIKIRIYTAKYKGVA